MVKDICKDVNVLLKKSSDANLLDLSIAYDLMDTLKFNQNICVGLSANMIGINKKIISFYDNDTLCVFINPVILSTSGKMYTATEGCLSLDGTHKANRYDVIKVEYLDLNFKKHIKTYRGFVAQIIQHEIDHFSGILI